LHLWNRISSCGSYGLNGMCLCWKKWASGRHRGLVWWVW
jgi:hypothetical protein